MKQNYTILSIETSLDETCAAVTINDAIVSNVIFSQVKIHKEWGGVVPMLAKRAHEERIDSVIKEAFKQANITIKKTVFSGQKRQSLSEQSIDAIAVTVGPGQALALEVGIRKAKQLVKQFNKPLIAVSHMEGHLLSSFAKNATGNRSRIADFIDSGSRLRSSGMTNKDVFPLLGLLISGGHTQLVLVNKIGEYKLLGETLDDSIGEAFDKVGRMLGLGYPGGPIIERLAKEGNERAIDFPIPMIHREDLMFSFSGIKTAVLYLVRELKNKNVDKEYVPSLQKQTICDIAASFQRVATASLVDRLNRAVKQYKPKGIMLGGGVVSNLYVRNKIRRAMKLQNLPVYIPYSKKLFTDNAAMIGVCAFYKAQRGEFVKHIDTIERVPNLSFS